MTEKNHIRLTDKFIIERSSKEYTTFMTVDGHDLQDFVLELQSDFTSQAELQLQTLENGLIALNFDIVAQKDIEATHYTTITTKQEDLQRQLIDDQLNIGNNSSQIDELFSLIRAVGSFNFINPDTGTAGSGEMTAEFTGSNRKFRDVSYLIFNEEDLLNYSDARSFDSIFEGDIIEISQNNGNSFVARATYRVGTDIQKPTGSKKTAKVEVELIEGLGAGNGIPFYDENNNSTMYPFRVEVYPAPSLETFAVKTEVDESFDKVTPIGTIMMWMGSSAPAGWALCKGGTIPSGNQYQKIRDILRSSYYPNFSGYSPAGAGGNGISNTLGNKSGSKTAKPSGFYINSAGKHYHSATSGTAGNHFHYYGDSDHKGGGTGSSIIDARPGSNYKTSENGSHTHSIDVQSGGSHNHSIGGWDDYTRVPCFAVNFIIKAYHAR